MSMHGVLSWLAKKRAISHYTFDEPQRRLSGQRSNGELLS
jgi:hypothetical protein